MIVGVLTRMSVAVATFLALAVLERRYPLRRPRHRANRRLIVNVVIGALGFGIIALAYGFVVMGTVTRAESSGFGLVRWLALPDWVAVAVTIVLLDYTLWMWHWLNHRIPLLWRFHAAHHADLDLDASTAIRFHPGELALSSPFRAAQVALIGASLGPLVAWELMVFVFVMFHHSNLRLPARVDRALSFLIITPRLHGIHHSRRPGELHANFGTLLSLWDRVHGLRVAAVPQESIDIGLPHQADPTALGVAQSLAVPFRRETPPRS